MNMRQFLEDNRSALIARCRAKVALRDASGQAATELEHGITPFIDQLIKTLRVEQGDTPLLSRKVSGEVGGGVPTLSEVGATAAAHGRELHAHGFSVEALVHDYGDLCQAITDLAVERDVDIGAHEFRVFNRCLDNAIAIAVTEYSFQHDARVAERNADAVNERLGVFAHELRNSLGTVTLALEIIRSGKVGLAGATGLVLDRSLLQMRHLIDRSLAEARLLAGLPSRFEVFSLGTFIDEVQATARIEAESRGAHFVVSAVDPTLALDADRDLLGSALANLLQNAFKFTRDGSEVTLNAYALGDRVLLDVSDHCGGLPPGDPEALFGAFVQGAPDRSGAGLGLHIARRSVEANLGTLRARNLPGTGCVFTINMPRHTLASGPPAAVHADTAPA
jgi:signal transduction histidine kinase